ncbi:MAG: HD domain-containing protein [Erysipelotrichaceae bacterium]
MNKLVNELIDGDKVVINLLLQQINRGVTAKGAAYLSLTLQDKSGTMDAKYWNVEEELISAYKPGMILEVNGEVLSHNKALQLRVNSIKIMNRNEIDLKDFVKASPVPKAQLKEEIYGYLNGITNDKIKLIVSTLLNEYDKDYFTYPAATRNHHDFVGGLATHVLGMLKIADSIAKQYPFLNSDILFGGVIIHDLGKLIELSGPVLTEYTVEGKLLGHISIAQAKIMETANKLGIDGDEVTLLRHMVLSHHGVHEYGSPVLPMIAEAEVLYLVDNLDARMNALNKALDICEEGDFTARIFALENRSFYKAKQ